MAVQNVQKYKRRTESIGCYRNCFVPRCRNTTIRTPDKVFLYVPKSEIMRKKWCQAAGCPNKKLQPCAYICEDHFDLQEDLKNYTYWKMMGGPKTFKRDACPRYFACQVDDPVATTSMKGTPPKDPLAIPEDAVTLVTNTVEVTSEFIVPDNAGAGNKEGTATACVNLQPFSKEQFTQLKKLITNSKGIIIKPVSRTVGIMAVPTVCHVGTSPCTFVETIDDPMDTNDSKENLTDLTTESKRFLQDSAVETSDNDTVRANALRSKIFHSTTRVLIEENPMLFIGVPKSTLKDIHKLATTPGLSIEDVYLILKKIRQNISNAVLSRYFGIAESRIAEIFDSSLSIIANYFRQFIVWPSDEDIKLTLPERFSSRYGQVQSIIDCFEIQIEHLEEPNNHTIFKKGSTKYLISVTPDGMINYISRGYPGLRNDASIAEISGYVDALPNRVAVLADRTFKSIEFILSKKKCTLIRPPVVFSGSDSSTVNPAVTKQIDNVRVHVNEIVTQLREFKLLGSHSIVEECLLPYLDDAMVVAVGLTNLQRKIA